MSNPKFVKMKDNNRYQTVEINFKSIYRLVLTSEIENIFHVPAELQKHDPANTEKKQDRANGRLGK